MGAKMFSGLLTCAALATPMPILTMATAQTPAASLAARELPAKSVPVPDTVSPQMQTIIAAPLNPTWNVIPKTADEWKAQVATGATAAMRNLPALREALRVKVE